MMAKSKEERNAEFERELEKTVTDPAFYTFKKAPDDVLTPDELKTAIISDENLNDEEKVQVIDILQSISEQKNSRGLPYFNDKYRQTYFLYADIFVAAEAFALNGDTENEQICRQMLVNLPTAKMEIRMNHTMKRLKEKGYYLERISFPLKKSKLWDSTEYAQAARLATMLLRRTGYTNNPMSFNLEPDTWYRAIEMTIFTHKPEIIFDPSFPAFVPTIDAHLRTLGYWVLTLAFVQHQRNLIFNLTNRFSVVSHYYERLRTLEQERQAEQKKQRETAKIQQDELRAKQAKYDEAIRETESVRSTLTEKIARFEERHLQDRDIILAYERENSELKRQLAEKNGDSLDDNSDENTDSAGSTYEELSDYIDVELPDANVIFLGGQDSLINKLKEIYPEWTFMNSSKYRERNTPQNPVIQFIYYTVVGHDDIERVSASIPSDTPKAYVSATNITLLVLEMKREYAKVFLKDAEDSAIE